MARSEETLAGSPSDDGPRADAASPADDTAGLIADAERFLRSHAGVIGVAALATVFAYGLKLTSWSLSQDEELLIYSESVGPYVEQGRPVAVLIEVITVDLLPLPFFGTAVGLAFLLLAAVLFGFLFMRASGQMTEHSAALLLFLIVVTTIPLNVYFLTFSTLDIPVAVGLNLAAISAWFSWLWAAEGWRPVNALAAIMFGAFAGLTYQGLAFVPLAAVLIAQLSALMGQGSGRRPHWRQDFIESVRLVVPVVTAIAIAGGVSLFMMRDNADHSSLLRWGKQPITDNIESVLAWIGSFLVGDGFVGGWLLFPTMAAAVLLFAVLCRRAIGGAGWWPVVLLIGILLSPFALGLTLGGEQLNRTMQVLPLVAGGIWLLLALALPARRALVGVLLLGALMFTIWHGSVNSRLFLAELTSFEVDRAIATRIVERLARDGWDGEPVPVVSVGRRAITPIEDHANDEVIGDSFYNAGGGIRTPALLISMGHPFEFATPEQRALAHESARAMPSWPAGGSVLLENGIAVVKFSDDYEFSRSARW